MQLADGVQDTLLRLPPPRGLGVASIVQRLPSQSSVNGVGVSDTTTDPTARQLSAAGHDTALSSTAALPDGSGGAGASWIDQFVPFQRSTSGSSRSSGLT